MLLKAASSGHKSSPSGIPSPSVSGFNGSVPRSISLPLLRPSPSQSSAFQFVGCVVCSDRLNEQGSVGFVRTSPVPLLISSLFETPSPSQSPVLVAVSVTSARVRLHALLGSVPFGPATPSPSGSSSLPFVTPSPSQSSAFQLVGCVVCSDILYEQGSVGFVRTSPVPLLISSLFETPSPSQSPVLVAVSVTSARVRLHALLGSVPFGPATPSPSGSSSLPFVTPSPSQSSADHVPYTGLFAAGGLV